MATYEAKTHKSEYESSLYYCFIGYKNFYALSKPALAPSFNSASNLMVEPFVPPVLSYLLYVPAACQANLTNNGPKWP